MTARAAAQPARNEPAWTGAAGDYDAWFDHGWGRYAFAVESTAVRRAANAVAGTRVLDAGCGTGRFAATLAEHRATVLGVDPDAEMLAVARPRLAGRCGRAAVERLPFPPGIFDVTVAVTVLEFVAEPAVAVAELARVTRPGGRIVIGALNPRSLWGLANCRQLAAGVWCHARFLDPETLESLGAPHGTTRRHGALHAPGGFPGLSILGPALEVLGRPLPRWGAFQVLTIDKVPR